MYLLKRVKHFFIILISLTAVRCFSKQFFVTPLVNQREEKKENKRSGRQAYKVSYSLKLLKLGPVCTTTKYRQVEGQIIDKYLLSCYLVTLLHCYIVTLLPCYFVTLLPNCYLVTLLPCYLVTLWLCYHVTLLPCYFVTVSPCYSVTLLLCFLVTLLLCFLVTLLLWVTE